MESTGIKKEDWDTLLSTIEMLYRQGNKKEEIAQQLSIKESLVAWILHDNNYFTD
jgi:hypothetical protein